MKKVIEQQQEKENVTEKSYSETIPNLKDNPVLNSQLAKAIFDRYFCVWKPENTSIEKEIARNKKLKDEKIVSILKAAKEKGETTTVIFKPEKIVPETFDTLYTIKLQEYLRKVEFSQEQDFIEQELKNCRLLFDEIPERKLMKRWIEFLENMLLIFENVNKSSQAQPQKNNPNESLKIIEDSNQLFELLNSLISFDKLKQYIRDNYLNIHPNNFTLERLEQIKRNISTWRLQLKDLDKDVELQDFIKETIIDIDLKINRYSHAPQSKKNSALHNKIESELAALKKGFNNETDYQSAIVYVENFLMNGSIPIEPILIKNKNIKKLAFCIRRNLEKPNK